MSHVYIYHHIAYDSTYIHIALTDINTLNINSYSSTIYILTMSETQFRLSSTGLTIFTHNTIFTFADHLLRVVTNS